MKKIIVLFINAILLIYMLTSCYSLKINTIDILKLKKIEEKAFIPAPLVLQNDNYSCGTTSVSMAISYYEKMIDKPIDKEDAWIISKTDKKLVRTLGHDIKGFETLVNHYGYNGEFVNKIGIDRLKQLISNGILVIIIIQPKIGELNTHAVLVHGYDDERKIIYVRDPANTREYFTYNELNDYWKAFIAKPRGYTINAGFIIYPKYLR